MEQLSELGFFGFIGLLGLLTMMTILSVKRGVSKDNLSELGPACRQAGLLDCLD